MRRALPHRILILASGGVSSGPSLVRAIRAGADGGWAGTVFVAATESFAHAGYKARLVQARSADATEFTTRFGPEFPDAPQRVLRNRAATERTTATPQVIGNTTLVPGVPESAYPMPKYSAIVPTRATTGDLEEMDMPAGSRSIFDVHRVRPAADIVDDFEASARDACDRHDDLSLEDD
jgi:enoyl-[acyl-carrier protein] reductase II